MVSMSVSSLRNNPAPRQRRSLSPPTVGTAATANNKNNNGGGAFSFIVGNTPAEMKSKKHMTIVRKAAMRSFLEHDKKTDKKHSRIQFRNEDSKASRPSTENHDEPLDDSVHEEWIGLNRAENKGYRKQSKASWSTISQRSQEISILETQTSSVHVLEPPPIVVPSRTDDQGRKLPYDRRETPLFVSFGEGIDPFGTMFQSRYKLVSVERMKFLCARFFGTRAMGQYWIPTVLSSPHTFLSTLSVASSHLDAILERDTESIETLSLRQEIMHLIDQNIVHPNKQVDDLNITALIQLIASEVIGREEGALRFHEKGIEAMITQRGGLNDLGVSGYLASTISWILLESAILREDRPRTMYSDYCTSRSTRKYPPIATIPESPIYRPRPQFETLKKSKCCTQESLALLNDVQTMMELFLCPTKAYRRDSRNLLSLYKDITTKYRPISELRGPNDRTKNDFKYEAIRIAAVLQATAIMRRVPLSKALSHAAATVSKQLSSLYTFPATSQSNDFPASPTSPTNIRHESMTNLTTSPSYAASLISSQPPSSYFDASRSSVSSVVTSHPSISSSISHPSFSSISTSHSSISSITASRPSIYPVNSRPHQSVVAPSPFDYNPFYQFTSTPTPDEPTALLIDLKVVLESSNMSECWQDMAGVLLWIALTVGAASHENESKVLKKWYSALSMRASVLLCFEHPEAVHATMLKMGQVVEALSEADASEGEAPEKKRRTAK
ncbi:hypothetical protein EKO04_005974 [Ascochyta lentis]|uniref:Uncharacterized protein n=1 Tax=Ascochyta lentis TaxID=205686 RepID=A0A8H7MD58_9PLEO|nr:hypothetical protein EKO04_005974 [Ascochyta lentis]